jgi:hypothetical protein
MPGDPGRCSYQNRPAPGIQKRNYEPSLTRTLSNAQVSPQHSEVAYAGMLRTAREHCGALLRQSQLRRNYVAMPLQPPVSQDLAWALISMLMISSPAVKVRSQGTPCKQLLLMHMCVRSRAVTWPKSSEKRTELARLAELTD